MAAQGDFKYIPFNNTELNASNPTVEREFLISGNGPLQDHGYLLIRVKSLNSMSHRIEINGKDLGGFDIPSAPHDSNAWFTHMDPIREGFLRLGTNSIRVTRVGNDNFRVFDAVVHWREGSD
jgi:hypothetical protein